MFRLGTSRAPLLVFSAFLSTSPNPASRGNLIIAGLSAFLSTSPNPASRGDLLIAGLLASESPSLSLSFLSLSSRFFSLLSNSRFTPDSFSLGTSSSRSSRNPSIICTSTSISNPASRSKLASPCSGSSSSQQSSTTHTFSPTTSRAARAVATISAPELTPQR
ncbi:hypothetical protein DACRYDRAFT_21487 [Dacryopinax primogenitus]|uniref:Uncharacterized protein n=1 Tax=Dacryopinax primogenitus (strain DJM 731) TaxID=1858805 RepID=M5FYX1_DACPD|nr:uncharacterized protein DACRYDRAFT_21487 [Dacryopinax primogenitus]EJU03241.1 hypothetical protein DACRYDRAFT_21487 [Dacryopinax primogenitus]